MLILIVDSVILRQRRVIIYFTHVNTHQKVGTSLMKELLKDDFSTDWHTILALIQSQARQDHNLSDQRHLSIGDPYPMAGTQLSEA